MAASRQRCTDKVREHGADVLRSKRKRPSADASGQDGADAAQVEDALAEAAQAEGVHAEEAQVEAARTENAGK